MWSYAFNARIIIYRKYVFLVVYEFYGGIVMSYKDNKQEAETVRERIYKIRLSDADVERLAKRALSYNLSPAELLENFIGDLVDGTYTNGSDERMYADQWAERCWFALDEPGKNMIHFFFGDNMFGREFSDLEEIKERIEDEKRTIASLEEDIANPENWDQIVHWDVNKGEYVDSYSSVDEYINECTQEIKDEKQWLLCAEEELNELKKDFADYMGNVAYDWDDQVEKCNKWYEENIKNLVENSSPEENNIPDQGHRRGSSR